MQEKAKKNGQIYRIEIGCCCMTFSRRNKSARQAAVNQMILEFLCIEELRLTVVKKRIKFLGLEDLFLKFYIHS